jgi:hypothetical protein
MALDTLPVRLGCRPEANLGQRGSIPLDTGASLAAALALLVVALQVSAADLRLRAVIPVDVAIGTDLEL